MTRAKIENALILFFRLAMAWTFLYAGLRQAVFSDFSVVPFLQHTKTFHALFAVFATPDWAPITSFMVKWGHLLIGLSLLTGLLVRVSAVSGMLLLGMYWMAHMDFPFIENRNNFIVDYHIVYAVVLGYLVYKRAGYVWGLDWLASKIPLFRDEESLHPLVA